MKMYEKTFYFEGSFECKTKCPDVKALAKMGTPPPDASYKVDNLKLIHSIVKEVSNDDDQVPTADAAARASKEGKKSSVSQA